MSTTTLTKKRGAQPIPEYFTTPRPIHEIYDAFPDDWVTVKVTARDQVHAVAEALVLARSRSRRGVTPAVVRAHRDEPGILTYVFPGGHRATSTEEWREQLAETASNPMFIGSISIR